MEFDSALYEFMKLIGEDPRIGPSHISLFLAVLYYYREQDFKMPVTIYGRELRKQARISAVTYHKCLQDLIESKCIVYEPSYNPEYGSLIYLVTTDK